MKKFIRLLLLFSLMPAIITIGLYLQKVFFYSHEKLVPTPGMVVFAGDSRIMNGLNDKIVPNAVNLAKPAEPYLLTYYKLKSFIDSEKPSMIFMSFSYSNISLVVEQRLKNDRSYQIECASNLYPFVGPALLTLPISKRASTDVLFKNTMRLRPILLSACVEGYVPHTDELKPDYLPVIIKRHFTDWDDVGQVSEFQLEYFQKILDLTASKGITLHLISPPLHHAYREKVPEQIKDRYNELVKKITAGTNVRFTDLSDLLKADADFANYDHVSEAGSLVFTEKVKELVH